jgi:hypothetical protein
VVCRLTGARWHDGEAVTLQRAGDVRAVTALDERLIRRDASAAPVHDDLEFVMGGRLPS